eukprot:4477531-Amphidinium_carterae.1
MLAQVWRALRTAAGAGDHIHPQLQDVSLEQTGEDFAAGQGARSPKDDKTGTVLQDLGQRHGSELVWKITSVHGEVERQQCRWEFRVPAW